MSAKVYQIVTNKIKEKLKAGVVPWRQPWINGGAVNWTNQKAYRGVNVMLLDPGEYASFKQIKQAGGMVKKGEKGHLIVFWKWIEVDEKNNAGELTGGKTNIPFLRYYTVFEITKQAEGLKSKRKDKTFVHDPIEEAEKVITEYRNKPEITFASGRAYYMPAKDYISIPPLQDFPKKHEYYSTLFHESIHSTGHKKRLNRKGVAEGVAAFGSETYSKEELIAEIGAAMLCGVCGIENHTIDNSASYINSWLRKFDDDPKMIVHAAAAAQKAADYIQNIEYKA